MFSVWQPACVDTSPDILASLFYFTITTFLFQWALCHSGSSTPSGFDPGSGRITPSTASTVGTIDPGDLKAASRCAPNIPLEMELPGVKIVHAQFNTPMQLYSDDNIMESLQGQVSTILGERSPRYIIYVCRNL